MWLQIRPQPRYEVAITLVLPKEVDFLLVLDKQQLSDLVMQPIRQFFQEII